MGQRMFWNLDLLHPCRNRVLSPKTPPPHDTSNNQPSGSEANKKRNGHCVKVVWFGNDSTHAFQSGLTDLFVARKDGTQMERYRLRKRVLVKGSLAS